MTDNKTLNETLRRLLATNIVCFTYKKVNGEIRHAKGTRNLTLARGYTGESIPSPTGYEQPNSYYDVESLGWRSYRPENLISIDGVVARTDTDFAKKPTSPNEPKKGELPKREIPVKFHTSDGTDIPIGTAKVLGNPSYGELPIGDGKSVRVKTQPVDLSGLDFKPISEEEISKTREEIRKSWEELGKDIEFIPIPFTDKFARLVARYVVDEIVERLAR